MKYIIIGLGNYGQVLAKELTVIGHEVIGTDLDPAKVDMVKDDIATAFVLDATDEQALSSLPLRKVDVVIVAIGENFGASVKVVALLKKNKVKHIYARAIDDVHSSILEAIEIDRILTPEEDAAYRFVRELEFGAGVEIFKIDKTFCVFMFNVPEKLIGYGINELNLNQEFELKVIALKRGSELTNSLGISCIQQNVENGLPQEEIIQKDDAIVCYGKYVNFKRFWNLL